MTDCTCQKTFRHGGVSGRRACESLENKANPRSPLSKGMPNHNQMSAKIVGLRRLHAENPQFSVMPSGEAPYQIRFCQRTSVALLRLSDYKCRRRFNGSGPSRTDSVSWSCSTTGTAQIAAKICSKDGDHRIRSRSRMYCPYRMTLSHSMGLTCSSMPTSIAASSGPRHRTIREISLACQ